MTTEKHVLSWIPTDKGVIDGNACNIPGERCECSLICKEGSLLLRREMDNRQIGEGQDKNSCESIKTNKADRDPDPNLDFAWSVQVSCSKESGHGDDVLNDEELIIPATHGRERSENNKRQNDPCRKTMLGVVISLYHSRNIVKFAVVSKPKGHVNCSRQPQRPRNPAMVPI